MSPRILLARAAPAAAVLASLWVAACSTTSGSKRSAEDQLFSARQEYRQTIDDLYRAYGGTLTTGSTPTPPGTSQGGDVLGHVASEADRSYFERQCLSVGRGERPFSLSSKMQAFLDDPAHARGCRDAAVLDAKVRDLEKRVPSSKR